MPMRTLCVLFLTLICANAKERILSFDSEIRVGRDGYLDVVETIRVNVEGYEISRGIYRDFPQEYKTKWGLKEYRPFEVTGVKRNGTVEPYSVEGLGSGTRVRIGSADVLLVKGSEQEYEISYRTGRQLWFDEKGDELYWNVTGNFWNFPIVEAKARVVLPEGIEVTEAEAYTGPAGAKGRDYVKTEGEEGVSFDTTVPLGRREGLTIVVRWEPGKLDAAAYEEPGFWVGNGVFFLGAGVVVLGLLFFVMRWFAVGRDPARGVLVPGWEPPNGFSPAAVRYLKKMRFDNRCFTAAVLSLGSKGFLKIEGYSSGTYELIKRKGKCKLPPDEKVLYERLFAQDDTLELQQANHARISEAKTKLEAALKEGVQGAFFRNNTNQWLVGLVLCLCGLAIMTIPTEEPVAVITMMVFVTLVGVGIGAVVLMLREGRGSKFWGGLLVPLVGVVGIMLMVIGQTGGVWCALATLVVLVAAPLFHFLMKAPTKEGRKVLDVIDGFREYLSVAEEDRLNLENPPERTPELFERFLPYALALGVEQKWSEKFDDVLAVAGKAQGEQDYSPSFYTGGNSGFQNALIGAGIGAAIGGALAASSVAPSTSGSSSGGGYSGGGGSSGGGGGGGGGGGW